MVNECRENLSRFGAFEERFTKDLIKNPAQQSRISYIN